MSADQWTEVRKGESTSPETRDTKKKLEKQVLEINNKWAAVGNLKMAALQHW